MKQVDSTLFTIERIANSTDSPFTREVNDLADRERTTIIDLIQQLRLEMKRVLDELSIPLLNADRSARWTIEALLRSADVPFSDLGGRRLEGYGELDPEAARVVARLSLELRRIVESGIFMLGNTPKIGSP
ncbi:MAG: hypothetical protein M3037_05310 [Gemmatimonadota bacterium]|nr:hypothetical protein [Gemmatimonadota bacterium]